MHCAPEVYAAVLTAPPGPSPSSCTIPGAALWWELPDKDWRSDPGARVISSLIEVFMYGNHLAHSRYPVHMCLV